jgi:hypothetical protein
MINTSFYRVAAFKAIPSPSAPENKYCCVAGSKVYSISSFEVHAVAKSHAVERDAN